MDDYIKNLINLIENGSMDNTYKMSWIRSIVECCEKNPKTRSRQWLNEMRSYAVNQAKWKSANEFCLDHGMEFKILTEDHLNIKYK